MNQKTHKTWNVIRKSFSIWSQFIEHRSASQLNPGQKIKKNTHAALALSLSISLSLLHIKRRNKITRKHIRKQNTKFYTALDTRIIIISNTNPHLMVQTECEKNEQKPNTHDAVVWIGWKQSEINL